jgi:hypothetical protein
MLFVEVGDDGSAQDAEPPSIALTEFPATQRSLRNTLSSATCSDLLELEVRNCPGAEQLTKKSRTQILGEGSLPGLSRTSVVGLKRLLRSHTLFPTAAGFRSFQRRWESRFRQTGTVSPTLGSRLHGNEEITSAFDPVRKPGRCESLFAGLVFRLLNPRLAGTS